MTISLVGPCQVNEMVVPIGDDMATDNKELCRSWWRWMSNPGHYLFTPRRRLGCEVRVKV
jgi:hypothetical protein